MTGNQAKVNKALEAVTRILKRLDGRMPGPAVVLFVAALVWLLSGIFMVGPDELGVIKTFGRKARVEKSGIHYHLPYPISTVIKPNIRRVNRLEFGFRTAAPGSEPPIVPVPDESLMLTGDENIVDVRFIVQYKIGKVDDYLFRLAEQETSIRAAAESIMRSAVGRARIDLVLTTGKQALADEVRAGLQEILDKYKAGVKVVAVWLQDVQPPPRVRDAFKSVVTAREKMNKTINEARSLADEIVPVAKGRARVIELEAEGYYEETRKKAMGNAARFLTLLEESRKAREVTRSRLYLEAMEEVMSKAGRIVLDPEDKNLLPLVFNMPLSEVRPPDGAPEE